MDNKIIKDIVIEWIYDEGLSDFAKNYYNVLDHSEIALINKMKFVGTVFVEFEDESVDLIPIGLSDEKMNKLNARGAHIALYGDDLKPMITITSETFEAIKKSAIELFIIYHELGHYYSGHMNGELEYDEMIEMRVTDMEKGKLFYQEKEADSFAAKYIGKEAAICALSEAMARRMKFSLINGSSDLDDLVMQEYKNRITSLS